VKHDPKKKAPEVRNHGFTPSPWKVCWAHQFDDGGPEGAVALIEFGPGDWGGFWIVGHNGFRSDMDETTRADPVADCHLIAAAPDLYAACLLALDGYEGEDPGSGCDSQEAAIEARNKQGEAIVSALRAALRKAGGGA